MKNQDKKKCCEKCDGQEPRPGSGGPGCVNPNCPCHQAPILEKCECTCHRDRNLVNCYWKCIKCGEEMMLKPSAPIPVEGWEKKKEMIDFLKQLLPYWEADDKDDYMYIVHHYDLERVAGKIQELILSERQALVEEVNRVLKIQYSGVRPGSDFEYGYTKAYENMRNYLSLLTPNK